MLNVVEINNTIEELENGNTTFDSCMKLASLYIVRENFHASDQDLVVKEYKDILPQYREYVEVKKLYQTGKVTEKAIENTIASVCQEVFELLQTMYGCADTQIEKDSFANLFIRISEIG